MTSRRDAALAACTLAGFAVALVAVEATSSPPFLALGAASTVGFELAAAGRWEAVRTYWERPTVQVASIVGTGSVIVLGALFAPAAVLSAGIGALVAYLALLALVRTGRLSPPRSWR